MPAAMSAEQTQTRTLFDELKPGDRIEVEHRITLGEKLQVTRTVGTVVRTERVRHGPHFQRDFGGKVQTDTILLELPDGELAAVTLDESSVLRRA
jgi:hypothetical protein